MISDNLMLNDDKTEFLIIGTRQQLAKVNINCIRVGSTDFCPITVVRNLGSWFDKQLTMSTHISKLCGVAFYQVLASICLENQRKCFSMHLLHLVLIIVTVFCMGCPTTSLTNCREFECLSKASL